MNNRTQIVLVFCCLAVSVSVQAQKFPYKKANMPFNAPPVERPIDDACSDEGTASGDVQKAQNRAKNNFSVHGTPVPIVVGDIDRLEKASLRARNCWAKNLPCPKLEMKAGLPVDRQQLVDIATTANGTKVGEGTIVVLEAKVLSSHYSNTKYNIYGTKNGKPQVGSGESVNCKNKQMDWNDIHVVLAAPGVTNECLSVTAEVSPHFRPDSWRRFHNMRKNSVGNINLEAKGVNFNKVQLVRITGPLFYDASHEPCSPGKKTSPARRSIWEIHPAYKLEVKVNGQWQDFDDWVSSQ